MKGMVFFVTLRSIHEISMRKHFCLKHIDTITIESYEYDKNNLKILHATEDVLLQILEKYHECFLS